MKLVIIQTKPRKGDPDANFEELGGVFAQIAAGPPPDLVVMPEAALTGYFLEGAVYDLALPAAAMARRLADCWRKASAAPVDLVCGFYENDGGTYFNAALYLHVDANAHEIVHVHRKLFLPTYGVFDEERFLTRGHHLRAFGTSFGRMAILICEDMWHALAPTIAALQGARYLIVPSASPGRGLAGKNDLESVEYWQQVMALHAMEHGIYIIYAGLAGFEGGKGMSGSSCVVNPSGNRIVAAPALGACIVRVDIDESEIDRARARLPLIGDLSTVLPDLIGELRS